MKDITKMCRITDKKRGISMFGQLINFRNKIVSKLDIGIQDRKVKSITTTCLNLMISPVFMDIHPSAYLLESNCVIP